jgi:hypothetical protein
MSNALDNARTATILALAVLSIFVMVMSIRNCCVNRAQLNETKAIYEKWKKDGGGR